MKYLNLVFISFLITITGCASVPIALTDNSVNYDPSTNNFIIGYQDPGLVYAHGTTQENLQIKGIGNPQEEITKLLEDKLIDVPTMLKPSLESWLQSEFDLKNGSGKQNLEITVLYGFFKYTPLGSHVRPSVMIELNFTNSAGEKIWRGALVGGPYNGSIDPMPLSDWLKADKDHLVKSFTIAAQDAILKLNELEIEIKN